MKLSKDSSVDLLVLKLSEDSSFRGPIPAIFPVTGFGGGTTGFRWWSNAWGIGPQRERSPSAIRIGSHQIWAPAYLPTTDSGVDTGDFPGFLSTVNIFFVSNKNPF
jgi:hypothetical protein